MCVVVFSCLGYEVFDKIVFFLFLFLNIFLMSFFLISGELVCCLFCELYRFWVLIIWNCMLLVIVLGSEDWLMIFFSVVFLCIGELRWGFSKFFLRGVSLLKLLWEDKGCFVLFFEVVVFWWLFVEYLL